VEQFCKLCQPSSALPYAATGFLSSVQTRTLSRRPLALLRAKGGALFVANMQADKLVAVFWLAGWPADATIDDHAAGEHRSG